ncbi:MAG: carboxypeptidase-like regulatory domain-containing protein [Planctomycetes bacterium]|nr:carboxypeptidase-like regulatory domain-containing protein [Planctomycetota bacterium]
MSARSWIAIVAGALLVLAAWFSLRIEGEPFESPGVPSTAAAAGKASETASRTVEEAASATASRQSALPHEPELELRGQVVTTTGAPIAGAKLAVILPFLREVPELSQDRQDAEQTLATGRSEADGSFAFRLDPDRGHDLLVEAQGFARIRMAGRYPGEEVRVVHPRSATIFGRVTDAVDGTPLAGVEVDAVPEGVQALEAASYHATTDRYGIYRIEALPSGVFRPEVDGRDHVRRWEQVYVVGEGQELRIDFPLSRGGTIHGLVTDGETKSPIEGASVVLRGLSARRAALTDADGRYFLRGVPVPSRFVSLQFRAPGYGEFSWTVADVGERGAEQDVFLLPGRRARGRVVGRDGQPVRDAWVLASAALHAHGTTQGDRRLARTDAEGRFELADLRIDLRHTLLVHAEGHATTVLDFPADEWARREIDLGEILLERPGTIAGRLRDAEGQALEDSWVLLDGEPRRRNSLGPSVAGNEGYRNSGGLGFGQLIARTDAHGRYAFAGLPAGKYRLTGRRHGCARPAHLEIELEEGGRLLGADLALDLGLSIRGVVLDSGGIPLAGAQVHAHPEYGRGASASAQSTSRGTFTLSGLYPENHLVQVFMPYRSVDGSEGKPRRFAVAKVAGVSAGTPDLRIVVPEAVEIGGSVVGPDGNPVPKARVSFLPEGDKMSLIAQGADREGRFLFSVAEGTRGTLVVHPPSWPVLDEEDRPDATCVVTLENVSAGTKGLLVRLPKLP